jgi:hypothetical protein
MTRKSKNSLDLFGLRLEEGIYRLLRFGDDQPFFFRPAFTFWASFRRHGVLLSSWFLFGEVVCPSRGSDPDTRNGHAIANRACLPLPGLGHK